MLRVHLICVSLDFLLYLAKPSTIIDHSAPVKKWHLKLTFDLDLWPWTLTLTFDLDLKTGWKTTKYHVKTHFLTVWPWTLTYDLDLQSQPSQGQGRPSCQKSRSKVKRFSRESVDGQTDGRTDATKRIISLCFAVDNNLKCFSWIKKYHHVLLHLLHQDKSLLL